MSGSGQRAVPPAHSAAQPRPASHISLPVGSCASLPCSCAVFLTSHTADDDPFFQTQGCTLSYDRIITFHACALSACSLGAPSVGWQMPHVLHAKLTSGTTSDIKHKSHPHSSWGAGSTRRERERETRANTCAAWLDASWGGRLLSLQRVPNWDRPNRDFNILQHWPAAEPWWRQSRADFPWLLHQSKSRSGVFRSG